MASLGQREDGGKKQKQKKTSQEGVVGWKHQN